MQSAWAHIGGGFCRAGAGKVSAQDDPEVFRRCDASAVRRLLEYLGALGAVGVADALETKTPARPYR